MEDEVLSLSRRGHTAQDSAKAVALLRRRGFGVGIQLMPGLPGDSSDRFRSTVEQVVALEPDTVRLYPTLVLEGTTLAAWYRKGEYDPLTLEGAVDVCVESCLALEKAGISVIRIGLMSSPDLLAGRIIAGPWHPSFGFLVRCKEYHRGIEPQLPAPGDFERIRLRVSPKEISLVRGFQNQGIGLIQTKTGARVVAVSGDDGVPNGTIAVEGG
jgi:histone acetyltransferase (RNA polymerase elongator complex component)